jgi:Transposase
VLTGQVCRKHGISGTTFFKWKARLAAWMWQTPVKLKMLEK